jgi:hypothetical protein
MCKGVDKGLALIRLSQLPKLSGSQKRKKERLKLNPTYKKQSLKKIR